MLHFYSKKIFLYQSFMTKCYILCIFIYILSIFFVICIQICHKKRHHEAKFFYIFNIFIQKKFFYIDHP